MFSWLSGGAIRDILRPDVEGLIKLLEECLKAEKQFVLSVFESVASALPDLRLNETKQRLSAMKFSSTMQRLSPCLLYTSPSPRDRTRSRMPSSA